MRVAKMPYLQLLDGVFQVQIVVPPKLQTHLPSPHTGKASLTKALATGNKAEANRLAVRWIADFQAILNEAEAALRGEDGWKRYTYYPGPYAGSFGGPRIVRAQPRGELATLRDLVLDALLGGIRKFRPLFDHRLEANGCANGFGF